MDPHHSSRLVHLAVHVPAAANLGGSESALANQGPYFSYVNHVWKAVPRDHQARARVYSLHVRVSHPLTSARSPDMQPHSAFSPCISSRTASRLRIPPHPSRPLALRSSTTST